MSAQLPTVALVTLGCARNEVDSEELAARLEADGFQLVDNDADADISVVNTCGFIDAAKKDSIDTLLAAAQDRGAPEQKVVAVGCLAQRYGADLAAELPEADAVLGFDDYPVIAERLRSVLAGDRPAPPVREDRRTLLPIAPVERADVELAVPGHGSGPAGRQLRRRLEQGPTAALKIASGCDRRCSFCAIPSFRGAFVSRPPEELLAEAQWLAEQGVKELFLVSENTTSYGKDLGNLQALEGLLPQLAELVPRVRVSYLQPAEMRGSLIETMASTAGVTPYFDLSFQHASGPVLRSMRRFGDTENFLRLLADVRAHSPQAGVRSNFIVGFPGESEADFEVLCDFVSQAGLDAVGVFGYSDEDGTAAVNLPGKLSDAEIGARVAQLSRLVEEATNQRAEQRIGERLSVLVESSEEPEGRAEHQGPDVDGITTLSGNGSAGCSVGDIVTARVVDTEGVDLVAQVEDAR